MLVQYRDSICDRGLFAYVWCVMDTIRTLKLADKLFVDLSFCTPYYDENHSKTNNVWEYYFKQPYNFQLQELNFEKIVFYNQQMANNSPFIINSKVGKYNLQFDKNIRELAKYLIDKYLFFTDDILEECSQFEKCNFNDKIISGIHIRSGAHFTWGHAHGQSEKMSLDYYSRIIENELKFCDKFFLITPDMNVRTYFKNKYGDKIIYYFGDALSLTDGKELAFERKNINYLKGKQAVIECILLSKCEKMFVSGSNLGCLSTLLGDNEYVWIDDHINYSNELGV